jgi:hypothetical protein
MEVALKLTGQPYRITVDVESIELVGADGATLLSAAAVEQQAHAVAEPEAVAQDPLVDRVVRPLATRTTITVPVAGGKAGGYFKGLKARDFYATQAVTLVYELDNEHDPYAVAVFRPAMGCAAPLKLGYIPANLAPAVWATLFNNTDTVRAHVAAVHANGSALIGLDIEIEIGEADKLPF